MIYLAQQYIYHSLCTIYTVYAGQGGEEHQTQKCCNSQGYQDEGEEIQQRQRGKPTVLFFHIICNL